MKKFIPIIGLALIITAIIGWQTRSYSNDLPYPEPTTCAQSYVNAFAVVKDYWENDVLGNLMDQQKPSSEMVDEAFESLRTYQCMLEYICRSVRFSGIGDPDSAEGGGLTSVHIGSIPGCQKPQNVGLPSTWEAIYTTNKFPFFDQCMTDQTYGNINPDVIKASENYQDCMNFVAEQFACGNNEESLQDCTDQSIAYVKLETALKNNSAEQKASALENKLSSIITKMLVMEAHVGYMKSKLQQLESRYACSPPECS
ncbi:hypothetical protein KJ742_00110 [Patescibacteria group bacterium]|nr:hypothetical protein [Patescibacteria group bacterium]MBU1682327.1 hypothetical protein [Patescibacteria group bacterium]MBU1935720.1 hypothetical protein [Patescibacteria group bacterium]